jgi:hypothetical protein
MKTFAISWISFFDNILYMEKVEAESLLEATKLAVCKLTEVDLSDDLFKIDLGIEGLKHFAFDCDGMVGALEV